ncbi:MAG: UDP-N-acetylmuramate--L-alanine ligase [Bacteroidetes bacterium B1(2017)]|nr:MAG: UDP-N-acetylmuramate--L-alanine ligase [Bacteroidetes bacterium B1(2017)]
MNLSEIKTAYFLGIGGIGMSAIARYFNHVGIQVIGYDKTETPLTKKLCEEGMHIHYVDDVNYVTSLSLVSATTLVVLTPAIPKDHKEWAWFKENMFLIQKRSEVLGLLSKAYATIGVAGTHGKTTTSTMVAHILTSSAVKCNAFLGGISSNYQSNLLLHPAADTLPASQQYTVVEADEFDRSFLTLHPIYSVITSTDADHLDIYGDHSSMQESFLAYANRLVEGGILFLKYGLNLANELSVNFKTYGIVLEAQIHAFNIRIKEAEHIFDLNVEGRIIKDLELGIPGLHNIENAVAASAVALQAGVTEDELRVALKSFRGVKRRFEYIIKESNCIFIDDYAHHPEELRAILSSVKRMYPNHELVAAFQPHLFTRTRDFAEGFAETLSMVDNLFLLDIYPARELPIEGVSSGMLLENITSAKKQVIGKQELVQAITTLKPSLFLTLGAGDIDALVEPIKQGLLS